MKSICMLLAFFTAHTALACTNFTGTYQFEDDSTQYSIKQKGCSSVSFGNLPNNVYTVKTDGTFQHVYDSNILDSEGKIIGVTNTFYSAVFIEDLLYVNKKDHTEITGDEAQDFIYQSTKSLNKNKNLLNVETNPDGGVSINVAIRVK